MQYGKYILSIIKKAAIGVILISCAGIRNNDRPIPEVNETGRFITVRDGLKIFIYEYIPLKEFKNTIYIISGITGINHRSERDLIELLSNNVNRVIVIHPRGTGFSDGPRGDFSDLSDVIEDYTEIIRGDIYFHDSTRKLFLFGHSMSCAIAIRVANELERADGIILINPPYKLKSAKGMSPKFLDYLRFAGYYIFAPHVPVVNMAGDPSILSNEDDRRESELRNNDPLLVKYFSMRSMIDSKRIMNGMADNAAIADYPLLLIYGSSDSIADKEGCDEIFSEWKSRDKNYEIVNGGSHGKSTVLKSSVIIREWIARFARDPGESSLQSKCKPL